MTARMERRLYVTLEPCNHTGRTGPCSEAIVKAGVARVVAAMEDPNPKTRGNGFATLRTAGIEVQCGLLEAEAQKLNEGFTHWITTGKPYVTLKSALTLDGQLALPQTNKNKKRLWITSEESRAEVQLMRHASDALLTGIGTILSDNPLLTDRSGQPRRRRLLRVIVDTRLRLPLKSRIVQTVDDDLLVFTAASLKSAKARALQNAGVELVATKARNGKVDLAAVIKELGRREILGVLLEAGPAPERSRHFRQSRSKIGSVLRTQTRGRHACPFHRQILARISCSPPAFLSAIRCRPRPGISRSSSVAN